MDEREEMICDNIGIAYGLADQFARLNKFLDREEWRGIAAVFLCEAADRYDPAKGTKFSTFAYCCIKNKLLNEVRNHNRHNVEYETISDIGV